MSTCRLVAHRYEVLGFVLEARGDEPAVSRTVHCGAFASVEEAFALARELAIAQWRAIASNAEVDAVGAVDCDVETNEFGYDIRRSDELIARFWIFDPEPAALDCA